MSYNLPQKHAEMLGFLWFSLFFSLIFPLGIIITIAGIGWTFAVDKVFFY